MPSVHDTAYLRLKSSFSELELDRRPQATDNKSPILSG
jgi:hypothetical protein